MTILPTLRQLQFLVAVVDQRHFGRAAERCRVTQSTLSAGLKDLENALQAKLVERTKRKVLPTPLGEALAEQARALLAGAETIVETARAGGEPLSGPFRLGTIPTIGPFVLPRVLQGLRRAYPDLRLFIREDQTRSLLDRLRMGELEAALIALPYDVSDFEALDLGADPFWLVAPRNHPLVQAKGKTVAAGDVSPGDLLLLEDGHCLRDQALAACQLADRRQVEPFAATSLQTLVPMVESGLGVTLLPKLAIDGGLLRGSKLVTVPLSGDHAERSVGLAWRKGSARRPDFERLGEEIRAGAEAGKA